MWIGTLLGVVLLFCVGCGSDRAVGPGSDPAAKPTSHGPEDFCRLNLISCPDPYNEDWFGAHAWGTAIEEGDLYQVRFWVEAGIMHANQRLELFWVEGWRQGEQIYAPIRRGFSRGDTPLIIAAEHKRAAVARYLLDQGADVHAYRESYGGYKRTALMIAASAGALPIVKMLVERGAQIEQTDYYGEDALFFSLEGKPGQLAVLKYLVSEGANVNRNYKPDPRISTQPQITTTPLLEAARFNGPESSAIMTHLLEKGAQPNRRNEKGWTALMLVAKEGYEDSVRLLVSFGANVNLRNAYGRTAADEARWRGHGAIADYLDEVAENSSS